MRYYLRLASALPAGQVAPGTHPDWPVTQYPCRDDGDEFGDYQPAPDVECIGPFTAAEVEAYFEAQRPAYEAANAANAAAQLAWREAPKLPDARGARFSAIDNRTNQLIAAGFTHASKQFSLSIPAQVKLLGVYNARASVTYPVVWNLLDDVGTHSIADAAEVEAMYLTAVEAVRVALDGGTELKEQVRDATTLAAIEAVVDAR